VEAPTVSSFDSRVFMDSGSGLNILYARTLNAIGISWSPIRPSKSPFFGIVPGVLAVPLGRSTCQSPDANNTVEYEALLHGLRVAVELGVKRLRVRGDSELVVN
jgi:hypothetical protein